MTSYECRYCGKMFTGTTRREAADKRAEHIALQHPVDHEMTRFKNRQHG